MKKGMKSSMIPVYGGSYSLAYGVSMQRTVNLLPEMVENEQGKAKAILRSTNGTRKALEVGTDSSVFCRGLANIPNSATGEEMMVGVWGPYVYVITWDNGTLKKVEVGSIGNKPTPVSIAWDETRCMIADGSTLWEFNHMESLYVIPSTFKAVNLTFQGDNDTLTIVPDFVVNVGHRFVVNRQGTGEFWFSKLMSDEFDATNYYTAETNIDNITAIVECEGNLHVFGSNSCEVWSVNQSETEYDPFSWIGGSTSDVGCIRPWTISKLNGDIVFLGSSNGGKNTVFVWRNGKPERISDNAMESYLDETDMNSIGFAWYERGHQFHAVQNSGRTWVWDVSTGLWHERSERTDKGDEAWECDFSCTCRNKTFFGSRKINWLLDLPEDRWIDYKDEQIVRTRITSTNWDDMNFMSVRQLFLDCETGTTPELINHGKDPWVMLSISADGGCTWADVGWSPMGRQGEFWRDCMWRNLGYGRSFIFKFSFSDPCPIILRGLKLVWEQANR